VQPQSTGSFSRSSSTAAAAAAAAPGTSSEPSLCGDLF
jgi:hypothetical protein